MKLKATLLLFLIFSSCTKSGEENEMLENVALDEEIIKYDLYISSSDGGVVHVSSPLGEMSESDLDQARTLSFTNPSGDFLSGKFAGSYNRDTALNLMAISNEGFQFVGWIGYKCNKCYWAATPFNSNEHTLMLSINSDVIAKALFEPIPDTE